MESSVSTADHPKKRRRRRAHRPPLSGLLTLTDQLKGNVGTVSDKTLAELFPYKPSNTLSSSQIYYVAVTPRPLLSQDPVEDTAWTILPVRLRRENEAGSEGPEASLITFPANFLGLHGLAKTFEEDFGNKSWRNHQKGIDVWIWDIELLNLDRICVTVDGDALNRHEEVQRKFGGGFDYARSNGAIGKSKGKGRATPQGIDELGNGAEIQGQDSKLISAVREALTSSTVIRQNDFLPLPLPAHPITHVPLPPARIALCEPVAQGVLANTTKIIVNRVPQSRSSSRFLANPAASKAFRNAFVEESGDTLNEQFHSAAESIEQRQTIDIETVVSPITSDGSETGSDDLSDDSLQSMVQMQAPQLPIKSSAVSSSTTATTPRASGSRAGGLSTPGSAFSSFSTITARQHSRPKAKLLRAQGLISKIPDEVLHPKPTSNEDDEARVFVDMKTLMKIGCFSGDWVQIQAVSSSNNLEMFSRHIDQLSLVDNSTISRPAMIYGLADLAPRPASTISERPGFERRSSAHSKPRTYTTNPTAWLSPILLANLGQAEHIQVTPLVMTPPESDTSQTRTKKTKANTSSHPPVAKEMTFLRISTPLSTERPLQTGIFSALKNHFEAKKRIVKPGDLIALLVDTSISRLVAQPGSVTDTEQEADLLSSLSSQQTLSPSSSLDIAWFRVGHTTAFEQGESSATMWRGAVCVEPTSTRMRQSGSEACKVPPSIHSSWQHYLGVKPLIRTRGFKKSLQNFISPLSKNKVLPLRRRLRELLAASTSPQAIHLGLEPIFVLLHSAQRNIGKATFSFSAASDLGLHVFDLDAHDILSESGSAGDVKTEALLKARVERALSCGPSCTVILIRHVDAFTADRMVTALRDIVPETRAVIATTTDIGNIPEGIRSLFTHEIEITAPDEGEREKILRDVVESRAVRLAHDVDLSSIAVKSAALVAGDLVEIVDRAVVARQGRLEHILSLGSPTDHKENQIILRDALLAGGEQIRCVTKADFEQAVEAARNNFADAIGAPKIPNVSWDDVGGLENVKDAVMETIQLPLERPELFAKGMKKRSGILFYGPPGTGKTLLAKAIATEFSLNFFSVKGPELLNMYIGESEANVRRVFQRARDARPCVVFFDELDSVAPKRGNQGDSGGVMDRIVSQLLAELDGMSDGEEVGGGVFVIGATNRPDLLDQALLRPGRFDKMLYLGISDTHMKQLTILEALTRKFTIHSKTSLKRVAESLPFTYTGADLYALCSDAMLKAITRQANAVDAKINALPNGPVSTAYFFDHLAEDEDIAVMVTEEDFFAAQRELVGSVSAKELEHYHRVRQTFEGPSSHSNPNPSLPETKNNSNSIPNGHLNPPLPTKRPNLNPRTSTAISKPPLPAQPVNKGKGKGKATQWDSDDDDDDDDAYVTSNDFVDTPERRLSNAFGEVADGDDEELYQ